MKAYTAPTAEVVMLTALQAIAADRVDGDGSVQPGRG